MGRIGDWVNRQRHNKGYGVQSPSDFFFVTQVLKERLPYYAYPLLEEIAKKERCNAKHLKDVFRITNYHKPLSCIVVESPATACAMAIAKPASPTLHITTKNSDDDTHTLLSKLGCEVLSGDTVKYFSSVIKKTKEIGMLYVGNSPERAELLKTALCYTSNNSVIIIEGINRDKTTKEWWQSLVNNPAVVITYDMHSYGLLLFNKERHKQHYILKR